jgi:hypothetical protein
MNHSRQRLSAHDLRDALIGQAEMRCKDTDAAGGRIAELRGHRSSGICSAVKRLLQLFALLVAVAWAPITSHCTWEDMPGLQFLKCASDTAESSNCGDEDTCFMLETAAYKVSETETAVPPPMFNLLFQLALLEVVRFETVLPVTAAPPEIPTGWQFSSRTALAPRAPSFVS